MPFLLTASAVLVLMSGGATASDGNPIGPAADGHMQCYKPNEQTKTCQSIAGYRALGDGRYENVATILLSPKGPVTFESSTIVEIKSGAVCGPVSANDIAKGKLRVAGRLLTDDQAAPILARITQAMAPTFDKEICTTYQASGSDLIAKGVIKGFDRPVPDQPVKWISPNDGYTVGP